MLSMTNDAYVVIEISRRGTSSGLAKLKSLPPNEAVNKRKFSQQKYNLE